MTNDRHNVLSIDTHDVLVEIECHLSNNLPAIVIVGSASKSVDEAKERLRGAFTSGGLQLPRKRITINLAPADIPKNDSGFDLAIATAILNATNQIPNKCLQSTVIIGELGLDGSVKPNRGIIGKLLSARKLGISNFIVPKASLLQAQLVPHITLIPIDNLKQLYTYLTTGLGANVIQTDNGILESHTPTSSIEYDLSEIVGQTQAKRALEIAAAGGHNVFFSGPPGTGKSMLAKCLPTLLPPLTHEEIVEVTQLHSLVSNSYEALVLQRPFRAPHHSASLVSIIGGGHNLRPGEISLSHRGVLFLDEMPEFNRMALESLRQPLEDCKITVARAKETVEYPANFILVATANPCPCGFYGTAKPCVCLPHHITRYQQRISGPILDRIDLHTTVQDVDHKNLLQQSDDKDSDSKIRKRIVAARALQARRYGSHAKLNGDISNKELKQFAMLDPRAKEMLDVAAAQLNISARSYMKSIKVARTIADLEGSASITPAHIAEALRYRRQEQAML